MPSYFENRVGLFVALAPVVRLDQTTNSLFIYASYLLDPLTWIIQTFGLHNLIPRTWFITYFLGTFCSLAPHICVAGEEGFFDFSDKIDNSKRSADKDAHSPSGAGWKNLVHYG